MRALLIALFLILPAAASAVTVAIGTTRPGDNGGINALGRDVAIASNNILYDRTPTDPKSQWVWVGHRWRTQSAVFEFVFDLTGFDITTARLDGKWGVDNIGRAFLNGVEIASLTSLRSSNFRRLHDYGAFGDTLFLSGENRLTFELEDRGGPAGFRATAIVTAEYQVPAVPVAPSVWFALLALGALGATRLRA